MIELVQPGMTISAITSILLRTNKIRRFLCDSGHLAA